MKRIILIDGENFLYGLRALGSDTKDRLPREDFHNFSFKGLINEVLEDEEKAQVFFYGARLKECRHDKKIQNKTRKHIKSQSHLVSNLQREGIQFVKVGNLRARETEPCPNCKHHEWYLIEKGVDVGLAVSMVTKAEKNTEIILISSDTDLLPAVKVAKEKSKIIYVGYENRLVVSLVRNTNITKVITKAMVQKYLKKAKK